MKKLLFILAIFILAFSITACSSKSAQTPGQNSKVGDNQASVAPVDDGIDREGSGSVVTPVNNQNNNNSATSQTAAGSANEETVADSQAPSQPVNNNQSMPTTDNQEKLLGQYSKALIKTNYGDIKVKFYSKDSPVTVNNFLNLAKSGFYNGTKFHRVIKDFMIQGGDPLSKGEDTSVYGTGGPGYQFEDEFNSHKLVLGSLAMANSGSDTNGSQFFIVTAQETPWLDGKHTNFGEVISGLDIVKKIGSVKTEANDRPSLDVTINSIELLK